MKQILGITLGIMTALGGFVDLGQIVFTMQAGALFGLQLLWTIVLGTLAIIVYMEMCGRIAAVTQEPVFAVVRTRLGFGVGLCTLIASNLLNVITCAAELGGIGIILHLLTGWPEKLLIAGAGAALIAMVLLFRFQWIERTLGLGGLLMIAFAVAAMALHPHWSEVGSGLLPAIPDPGSRSLYAYFGVGIFSAMLMEYEVHFYSSGAIEEDWKPKDLSENFFVASLGSVLGSLLTAALLFLAMRIFLPRHIFPELLSTAMIPASFPYGRPALTVALLGTLACLAGAAVETGLSGAYNLCQFLNKPWGKNLPVKSVPLFTAFWIGSFAVAILIVLAGARPLMLVNISVVFGMVIMPFTYYPILRTASDARTMGRHVNSRMDTIVGTIVLVLIAAACIAAIPLTIVTRSGQP